MANVTKESHQQISNPAKKSSQYDEEDHALSQLSHLPIEKNLEKSVDSAADRNQTRSSETMHDMFIFYSPNYQQGKVTKPTGFAAKSPYRVTQSSPALSKSSSKTSPGKRSVKKSEDHMFQKSKSTSLYTSRSKKGTKGGMEHEYEEHKVSIFSSPVKAKWLFVLLGLPPKIPTDAVELKTDIKNRQSRHAPSTLFQINGGEYCQELVPEDSPRPKASEKTKKSMLGSCFGIAGPVQI